MKKQFKLMALASVTMLFAACSQENLLSPQEQLAQNPENNAIQFGTYMGKTGTRAGATGDIITPNDGSANELGTTNKEFGVIAYNTGSTDWGGTSNTQTPNFMYNQKVSCTGGTTWNYAPIKYWPNGIDAANSAGNPSNTATSGVQKLSFFAYAPYVELSGTALTGPGIIEINGTGKLSDTNLGNNKTGEPTVKYQLDNAANANQVDLLWGLRGAATYEETDNNDNTGTVGSDYNVNLTKQSTDEKVNFQFKHALAKIENIQIQSAIDNNTLGTDPDTKTCITVRSITIQNSASNFASEGVFNLATGVWSNLNNSLTSLGAAFNFSAGSGTMNTNIFNAAADETYTTGTGTWSQTGVKGTATNVLSSDFPAFYVIPVGSAQELTCTITYDVKTYDPNLSGSYSTNTQTITNTISCNFEAGKKYKLVLGIGLTSVKFTASVANWTDGANQDIWLPSNVE